jgi:hypothetical protein
MISDTKIRQAVVELADLFGVELDYGQLEKGDDLLRRLLQEGDEEKLTGEEKQFRLETFDQFYNMYGRKQTKEAAKKKWMKLKRKDIALIFETLEAFLIMHPDPMYRPNPLTYINQKRWLDEVDTPKKLQKSIPPKRLNTWNYGTIK